MGTRLSIDTIEELERDIFTVSLDLIMKGGYASMVHHVCQTAAAFGADDYERGLRNDNSHQLSLGASTSIETFDELLQEVRERSVDALIQGEALGRMVKRAVLTAALWGRQNMKKIAEEKAAAA